MTLQEFFEENRKVALAYSGGVDSVYLLYAALEAGADVTAYYVKTAFQPQFEYDEALEIAADLGARVRVLPVDVLSDAVIAANPSDRCYWCKNQIMGAIRKAAAEDGCSLIIDGTNASDDAGDRPGMRALRELGVRSPLRLAGLTKAEIRRLSRAAELPTFDKPAYACLATRIAAGEEITAAKLAQVEEAEARMTALGFIDFRVRTSGRHARIEIRASQLQLLEERRAEVSEALGEFYDDISVSNKYREEMVIE